MLSHSVSFSTTMYFEDFAETPSHHGKSRNLQICPKAHMLNHPPGTDSQSHSYSCSHAEVGQISAKEIPF